MLCGVALLGVVTAALASWFVDRFGQSGQTDKEVLAALEALRAEVAGLRHQMRDHARELEPATGRRSSSVWQAADPL
jgi:voltage-gated potassium channel